MVAMAGLTDGMRVLEPSAGLGRILDAIASDPARVDVVAVEQSPDCCRHLYQQRRACTLKQGDFLNLSGSGTLGHFDRVIMNPPFTKGLDYTHTLAAARLLKPGARLVGLCYDGAKAGRIQALATSWERIAPGAFRDSGTMAGVCLFTINNN
jgi:phospholipid N-methyltransferase